VVAAHCVQLTRGYLSR